MRLKILAAFARNGRVMVLLLNFKGEAVRATVTGDGKAGRRNVAPFGAEAVLFE
jgi:hypothetical protein